MLLYFVCGDSVPACWRWFDFPFTLDGWSIVGVVDLDGARLLFV